MFEELGKDIILAVTVIVGALLVRGLLGMLISRVTRKLIERKPKALEPLPESLKVLVASDNAYERHEQRVKTLGSLLKSVSSITITIIALLTVLSIFGIPMAPLIASAGVGGVALGFGAQSLVKDYLSGIFMLAEDQFGVGDLIEIDGVRGTVEEVTLRVTKIRDVAGVIWYIRNGEVLTVGNVSQGTTQAVVDVPVAPDEDVERAKAVLNGVLKEIQEDPQYASVLVEPPALLGVGAIDAQQMVLQVMLKTAPNQQWGVSRDLRARAQTALLDAGIQGPRLPGAPTA